MTGIDHEAQAVALLAWHQKRGGDWETNYGAWTRTKQFRRHDDIRIRTIVLEELHAGEAVFTDPLQYLTRGA